jgi:hypothetical protein
MLILVFEASMALLTTDYSSEFLIYNVMTECSFVFPKK